MGSAVTPPEEILPIDKQTMGTPVSSGASATGALSGSRRDLRYQITYMLMLLDVLGICTASMLAFVAFPEALHSHPRLSEAIVPLYTAIAIVLLANCGTYSTLKLFRNRETLLRLAVAHLGTVFSIVVLTIAVSAHGVGMPFLIVFGTVAWCIGALFRVIVRRFEWNTVFSYRVLVIGVDDKVDFLREGFSGHEQVQIVDAITRTSADATSYPEILRSERLIELCHERQIDVIVLALADALDDKAYAVLSLCAEQGIRVERMAEFYEEWLRLVPVSYVNSGWCVHGFAYQVEPHYDYLHRAIDIVTACIGLTVFAIVYLPITVLTKLTSPGPVFYVPSNPRFYRVGLRGELFKIRKFRTMLHNAPAPINYTADDDPRITKLGKLLRKTKLDELPQFWNVLIGQMSLIGPRPLSACEDEEMMEQVPLQNLRRVVRPGLTGLGQVCYGTANTPEEHLERLQSDLYYIKHRSVALDLWVLGQTLLVCVGMRRRK